MNGQQLTEDNFDDVARQAGDALRRPAPADGMARIRQSRRRQQQVRAAAGGTALAAVIAIGAFVATRGDEEPVLLIQPDATTVPVTEPGTTEPGTTEPGTTEPDGPDTTTPAPPTTAAPGAPAPTGLSDEARAWVDARRDEGFEQISVTPPDAAGNRMLSTLAVVPGTEQRSAAYLADGRVVDTPVYATGGLHTLGDTPVIVQLGFAGDADPTTQVWALDTATDRWTPSGDLGIGELRFDTPVVPFVVLQVDDLLIVANNAFETVGDRAVLSADRAGAVVDADLTVTAIAPAPPGVAMSFTSASGGKALQMYAPGFGALGSDLTYDQPWQYDPAANEWSEIPVPEWIDCTRVEFGCEWVSVPDVGALRLEVATNRGLVARVPDGTVGLYDAATSGWTRLDDAPFELAMPTTAVTGDRVVVAPWRSGANEFGVIGVLDVATGTWTTQQVDIPGDVEERFGTDWIDVVWQARTVGDRVLLAPGPSFDETDVDPIAVYDAGSATWDDPTDDDVDAWNAASLRID